MITMSVIFQFLTQKKG